MIGDLEINKLDKEIIFPQYLYGSLNLRSLSNSCGLVLPDEVGDTIYLNGISSLDGVVLPYKYSNICLRDNVINYDDNSFVRCS